jgi:hypothetical protein
MLGFTQPTGRQERREWWRLQISRQQSGNVSVTEFCRRLGVTLSAFYYWKDRVQEVARQTHLPAPVRSASGSPPATATMTPGDFIPVSIINPTPETELEIELTNDCVLRLRGAIDPSLLHAAIAATGQLNGCGRGGD